jgi:hypothetical protein
MRTTSPRRSLRAPRLRVRTRRPFLAGLTLVLAFVTGIAVGHFRFRPWPVPLLWRAYRIGARRVLDARTTARQQGLPTLSADALSRVATPGGLAERRAALRRLVLGDPSVLALRLPDSVRAGPVNSGFAAHAAGVEVLRLETEMPWGVNSVTHWYRHVRPARCLVLYHEGHEPAGAVGHAVVDHFVAAGCDVLALAMPLYTPNRTPVVDHPRFGRLPLRQHESLWLVERPDFPALRYFVEPIAAALNHVLRTRAYERVGMVGLSGGGWTTTLYAALDPRVTRSYPVAGSEPFFLAALRPGGLADFEQSYVPLYREADYPELYVMGTDGGRRQLQVLNRFDPCCFSGRGAEVYAAAVRDVAARVGGRYELLIDDSGDAHAISARALRRITEDFLR